jgi:phosphate/sulfate permease
MVHSSSANNLKKDGGSVAGGSVESSEGEKDKKTKREEKESHMIHSTSTNSLFHGASLDKDEETFGEAIIENLPEPADTTVEVVHPSLLKIPTVIVEDEEDKAMLWNKVDALYCFRYLLLFNAALLSYAHGEYVNNTCMK